MNNANSCEFIDKNLSGRVSIRIDGDPFIFTYLVEYDEITYATVSNVMDDPQIEYAEYTIPKDLKEAKFIAETFIHKHAKYPWHKGESFYIEKDAEFNKFVRALIDR